MSLEALDNLARAGYRLAAMYVLQNQSRNVSASINSISIIELPALFKQGKSFYLKVKNESVTTCHRLRMIAAAVLKFVEEAVAQLRNGKGVTHLDNVEITNCDFKAQVGFRQQPTFLDYRQTESIKAP